MQRSLCTPCSRRLACLGFVVRSGLQLIFGAWCRGAVGPVRIARGQRAAPPSKVGRVVDDYVAKLRLQVKHNGGPYSLVDPLKIARPKHLFHQARRQDAAQLVGIGVSNCVPFISAKSEYNASKALVIRVLSKPSNRPAAGLFDHLVSFTDFLLPGFTVDNPAYERMSTRQWLDSMPARRKKALTRAWRNVNRLPWHKKYSEFGAFIKSELLPGFNQNEYLTPKNTVSDRIIQGPADETHIIAGPVLKPATKLLKHIWSPKHIVFYASVDAGTLSGWYRENFPDGCIAVAADYSGFDNSHSKESWCFVEGLYRRAGLHYLEPRLQKVLDAWRKPKGKIRGMGWILKYVADYMNASGRDDTALANALLNGFCMALSIIAAVKQVSVFSLCLEDVQTAASWLSVAVCGDDSLVAIRRPVPDDFRQRLSQNIAQFGFTAEAEKLVVTKRRFDHVFLGMRPYPDGETWSFGKTIGRAFWKRGWKFDQLDSHLPAWLRGVSEAELMWNQHVPLYADQLTTHLRLLGPGPKRPVAVDLDKPWTYGSRTSPYSGAGVRYIADGYGLAVGQVYACIEKIRSVPCLPYVIDDPVLRRVVCADDL